MSELKQVKSIRKSVTSRLKKAVVTFGHESGFRVGKIGESRPLRLCKLPKDTVVDGLTVIAVTEFGVITDVYGGAAVQEDFDTITIEILLQLEICLQKLYQKTTTM
jgi:hypothetical protein